jgi:hypothetical protein
VLFHGIRRGLTIFGKTKQKTKRKLVQGIWLNGTLLDMRTTRGCRRLRNGIRRLRATTTAPGRKLVFKHDKNTGVYVLKDGKGGINWYRYQKVILEPLLLPFAKECLKERPGTLVQEDGAPSHSSQYQQEVFDTWEISRLLWPSNSPNLNMIELCWF